MDTAAWSTKQELGKYIATDVQQIFSIFVKMLFLDA